MKEELYQATRAKMLEWYPEHLTGPGKCFYWMHAGLVTLFHHGLIAIPQAGDMLWPVPEQLNPLTGEIVTHFGYEWSPDRPESQAAMAIGQLPEIHIWLCIPSLREIIDFSTHGFKDAAKLEGLTWGAAEDPPPYMWVVEGEPMPALYRPHKAAIEYVLKKFFSEERAA